MELFKDKGVLELTKELTKELRTRSIEDKEIPRFIFVCGEQILDDKVNLIDTNIPVSYTHLDVYKRQLFQLLAEPRTLFLHLGC